MKKILVLILALLASLLISCGVTEPKETSKDDTPVDFEVPSLPTNPKPFNDLSASEIVAEIKIGWNLGNTLDANPNETSWGNPLTKKSNIDAIKAAGFNAIRIPVSWSRHVD
ncbi:cellulase family glycosylhydrolase, partial [Treponema sp. R6D11]